MSYFETNASSFPGNAVCFLTTSLNGVTFRGSGVAIGPHTVLTAAHLVYDSGTGAEAANVHIFPGFSGTALPSDGQAAGGKTIVHHFKISDPGDVESRASAAYDFAVIDTSATFSSWCKMLPDAGSGYLTAMGYPAHPSFFDWDPPSYKQWETWGSATKNSTYNVFDYLWLGVKSGNSGGPLMEMSSDPGVADAVVGIVATTGYGARLTTGICNAISNWQAADSGLWTTQPAPSKAVNAFVGAENAARHAINWTGGMDVAGIAGDGRSNSVIGWQSANLSGAHNSIVLDNGRDHYALRVDATGQTVIKDIGAGTSVVVEGANYVLFNGASAHSPGLYDQIVFIEGGANSGQDAQLVRLYEACFGRTPDLAGLESWQAQLDASHMSVSQIAGYFIGSAEFALRFGANPSDAAYITALYGNVLGRAPDAAGASGWITYLGAKEAQAGNTHDGILSARAGVLLAFSNSSECLSKVAPWLVDITKGGYSDKGLLQDAGLVLNHAAANHYLNMGLIDATTIPRQGGVISMDGAGDTSFQLTPDTLTITGTANTIVATNTTSRIIVNGNDTLLFAASGTTSVSCSGKHATITLAQDGHTYIDTIAGNETIINFVSGNDRITLSGTGLHPSTEILLTPSADHPVAGSSLKFWGASYVLNAGAVGTGSAADVAVAADALYKPAELSNERLVIIGQTTSGDTVLYGWGNGYSNPDGLGTHHINAFDLKGAITLTGVHTNSMTSHDFF